MDAAVFLLLVVAAIVTVILVWTGRKRFPLRIGLGNFFRRKTQVAIVVTGLLVGTAIISSSYVIQSTFQYTIRSDVFRTYDYVDELISMPASDGSLVPFNITVFDSLHANLSAMPDIAGLAPRYGQPIAASDANSGLFEPAGRLIGFDVNYELGEFVRSDGSSWTGTGLGSSEVIINQQLADSMEAKKGDNVVLYAGGSPQINATVAEIVQNKGRGAWNSQPDAFIRLDIMQSLLNQTGKINYIVAANVGGPTEGYLISDFAANELNAHLPTSPAFTVSKAKADAVDQAANSVGTLSSIFTLLGTFTIIAGILLIINIFVMLAEERKREMGVSRALGMRRRNLVQSFVAEGLLYALVSAAVGSLCGLLIAGVILWAIQWIFPAQFLGGVQFVLTWTSADLIRAFTIGFLITMATIALASWRVSKLNIVRAIRDIPEPIQHRATKLQVGLGAVMAILGAMTTVGAFAAKSSIMVDIGPTVLVMGLAVVLMRFASPRILFTAAGLFTIGWLLYPYKPITMTSAGIDSFIIVGVVLVFGGILVVMFNSDTMLAVVTRVARRRTWRPVIRTAIAYPMNRKFRTGITLASISLVMFTIATMSGIESMVSSTIDTATLRQSGGFDIIAMTNPLIPKPNWNNEFNASSVSQNITEMRGLSMQHFRFSRDTSFSGKLQNATLYGMPQSWTNVPMDFQALDPDYSDGQAAWDAIQKNDSIAILDGSVAPQQFVSINAVYSASVGDTFYFHNLIGATRHVKVIGILYESFVNGVFVGWNTTRTDFGIDYPSLFYFKVAPDHDSTAVSHDLERTFLRYQMFTFDLHAIIQAILQVVVGIFNLLEAYLALGLIVGIAGLGVITMRNVVERRTETGALRALGFRRSMVLRSYLFELSFIALTGILMGDILGVAISYDLYLHFFSSQGYFIIPWGTLILLSVIAFVGAVLATASPAIRASRMPPAEALRTFE